MRKKLMVLAASTAVLAAAALAGCSSQGESSGGSTAKETDVSDGADTADAAGGNGAAGAGENGVPAGDKVVLQIAHGNGTTWPGHIALEHMKQILDEDPDSGITIEIMPNGVLGGDNEVVQQVMLGAVQKISGNSLCGSADRHNRGGVCPGGQSFCVSRNLCLGGGDFHIHDGLAGISGRVHQCAGGVQYTD